MMRGSTGYQFGIRFAGEDPVVKALLSKELGDVATVLGSVGLIGLADLQLGSEQGAGEVPWNIAAGVLPAVGALGAMGLQMRKDPVARVAMDQSLRGVEKAAAMQYRTDPQFVNQYERAVQDLGNEVLSRMTAEYQNPDLSTSSGRRAAHEVFMRNLMNEDQSRGAREYIAPRFEQEMKLAAMRRLARPAVTGALAGTVPALAMMAKDWLGGGQERSAPVEA